MAETPRPIVIRNLGLPKLRWLVVASTLGLLLAGWGLYALGRSGIGLGATGPFSDLASLRRAIDERDVMIAELRSKVAELDTIKAAQDQERREVSVTIGELQAEVARQRQQLEVYKGIVATTEAPPDVVIRSLRIDRRQNGNAPLLRLSLAQPGNPRDTVSGTVRITIEGVAGGRVSRSLVLEIPYSFRYFENIEKELFVPSGVTPERVSVEVQPAGRGTRPVVQSEPWPR